MRPQPKPPPAALEREARDAKRDRIDERENAKARAKRPAWVRCRNCDEWWCTVHGRHVHDCACPEVAAWRVDPYAEGGH